MELTDICELNNYLQIDDNEKSNLIKNKLTIQSQLEQQERRFNRELNERAATIKIIISLKDYLSRINSEVDIAIAIIKQIDIDSNQKEMNDDSLLLYEDNNNKLDQLLNDIDLLITSSNTKINTFTGNNDMKDTINDITDKQELLAVLHNNKSNNNKEIALLKESISKHEVELSELEASIETLQDDNNSVNSATISAESNLQESAKQVAILRNKIVELNAVISADYDSYSASMMTVNNNKSALLQSIENEDNNSNNNKKLLTDSISYYNQLLQYRDKLVMEIGTIQDIISSNNNDNANHNKVISKAVDTITSVTNQIDGNSIKIATSSNYNFSDKVAALASDVAKYNDNNNNIQSNINTIKEQLINSTNSELQKLLKSNSDNNNKITIICDEIKQHNDVLLKTEERILSAVKEKEAIVSDISAKEAYKNDKVTIVKSYCDQLAVILKQRTDNGNTIATTSGTNRDEVKTTGDSGTADVVTALMDTMIDAIVSNSDNSNGNAVVADASNFITMGNKLISHLKILQNKNNNSNSKTVDDLSNCLNSITITSNIINDNNKVIQELTEKYAELVKRNNNNKLVAVEKILNTKLEKVRSDCEAVSSATVSALREELTKEDKTFQKVVSKAQTAIRNTEKSLNKELSQLNEVVCDKNKKLLHLQEQYSNTSNSLAALKAQQTTATATNNNTNRTKSISLEGNLMLPPRQRKNSTIVNSKKNSATSNSANRSQLPSKSHSTGHRKYGHSSAFTQSWEENCEDTGHLININNNTNSKGIMKIKASHSNPNICNSNYDNNNLGRAKMRGSLLKKK